ncbi:Alpha-L-fucosidase [Sphingobacterium spiritivorum ATCC 33300]|uniref:alpha-L-fucosidase n=1 Tax=Sphingobacterium spiritivorum ATCC 33300 TaxID=525372 RepID=C2FU19_SPHSI|nr:alpha-L-fucosidase [Sphingobacterium spiritivorum]EEI93649.1 Alpha-L-fucosidase [Sphingobacterium spiritivorum ATCC 33300]QQS95731.1 alpha-L-fucosidase [Sphingobacterium spiritivorum]
MKKRAIMAALLGLTVHLTAHAQQPTENNAKMEWFEDAKLGIFIHWGIYSVQGISESWAFFNNYINHENYMKQLNGFTASKYKPDEWAKLIHDSGAKYSVITTKHHDGVSLWDSKADKAITIKKDAQARQDVLDPFVKALQKTGLKTGLYYSLPDWSHPYYDVNTRTRKRYALKEEPQRWENYVKYYQTQLNELSELYHPDLIWFDGDWEHNSEEWKAKQTLTNLRKYNPNIIINSRLNHHGDYDTPEQGIPVVRPSAPHWELCYTMNDSWGYQAFDKHYKTPNMIVRTLVDCISMGGNLLLDIGPKEDGTIPEEQVAILKELGRWTGLHKEAVYGTRAGIPFEHYQGKSALSKDGKTVYLYLDAVKRTEHLTGISTALKGATVVGQSGIKVPYTQNASAITLDLNTIKFDPAVTVLALHFDNTPTFIKAEPVATEIRTLLKGKNADEAVYQIAKHLYSGDNLLKNNGLTVDGLNMNLPDQKQANPAIVNWISKHAEALYETGAGIPEGHYAGLTALSADKQTLYLFVEGKPTGPVAVKGLKNTIARIRIVGEGSMIDHDIYNKLYWSAIPGIVYINVPNERLNNNLSVIAVLLDKPIELYREKVGAIESNL